MKKKKLKKKRAKRVSKYPWYAKFIFAAARKSFRWSPEKKQALKAAYKGTTDDGEPLYECAECKNQFAKELVHVDHIQPVIEPSLGFDSWDNYFFRLFCPADNLSVLCLADHQIKTQAENAERRKNKE